MIPFPRAKYFLGLWLSLALVVIGNNNKRLFFQFLLLQLDIWLLNTHLLQENTPKKCSLKAVLIGNSFDISNGKLKLKVRKSLSLH